MVNQTTTSMERKEFLRTLGGAAAFALVFPCVGACSKSDDDAPPEEPSGKIDYTIDLNAAEAVKLKTNGGFFIKDNNVVIARTLNGDYAAASRKCSHEGNYQVIYHEDEFSCNVHNSRFNLNGTPLNAVTSNKLKIYQTSLGGDTLRVFE